MTNFSNPFANFVQVSVLETRNSCEFTRTISVRCIANNAAKRGYESDIHQATTFVFTSFVIAVQHSEQWHRKASMLSGGFLSECAMKCAAKEPLADTNLAIE